jgi:hypothetical protein
VSNRIDLFQSTQTRLALPAASVSVLLDGKVCPVIEPLEIVRGGWPEFSWARLAYNAAACTDASSVVAEDIEVAFEMGKAVSIRQYYNANSPSITVLSLPILNGQVDGLKIELGPRGERAEIVVRDFGANLKRISVHGKRVAAMSESSMFLYGHDTIFNPDGKANASLTPIQVADKRYTIFGAETSQSRLWRYAEVIDYLLSEYLPSGQLQRPGIEQLNKISDSQFARDLDVTGQSLMEALQRCCERIGLEFQFVPRFVGTDATQAIVFYRRGTGRTVELDCQRAGEPLSISKTNIAGFRRTISYWPVTHKYIGQGDFKIYEATFELVKAWDGSLEDTDYDKFSPSTNPDFYLVRDVYRKWCLNEVGDYTGAPYNQGEAFDFSKVFQTKNFARRRRRFWPALTTDKQGKSLGYYLQVSFDNGSTWWQYLYAFNNLLEECGVWLSSDSLDTETWVAALQGTLKFRITASVVSDERVSAVVANGPVNSVVPVVDHVLPLPRQFKHRKVSGHSIFSQQQGDTLGTPDEADDSKALYEFVRHWAAASDETIETINVQTPHLLLYYQVGDAVTASPDSRDLLGCRRDNRSRWWIRRVHMDFEKQCTNLKIVRQRRGNS